MTMRRVYLHFAMFAGFIGAIGCSSGGGTGGSEGAATGSGGSGSGGASTGSGGAPAGSGSAPAGSGSAPAGSGSAPAGSGGAPMDSGGAPMDSGGAPIDAPVEAPASGDGAANTSMSFFITSDKSMTGNLGGLAGADKRCQMLAEAAGAGGKTWHAYLGVAMGPAGTPVNAKDRIGNGPWYNVKGALVAMNVAELHVPIPKNGDYMLFITEKGELVNGNWPMSPKPLEHDILTGSNGDGTVDAKNNCKDWTSASMADKAWVGHTDGLGPRGNLAANYRPWNHSHLNGSCANTGPLGGAGRIACFAVN
jgi:hypothetical protein